MTREAGFYWVYVPGSEVAEVAMWTPTSRCWLLAGRLSILAEHHVGVLSEQLWPPEQRSACAHAPIFVYGGQCHACGTFGLCDACQRPRKEFYGDGCDDPTHETARPRWFVATKADLQRGK